MSTNLANSSLLAVDPQFPAPRFPVYRFSVAEYLTLADAGSLAKADVELLEGVIVPKMTRNSWHDATIGIVEEVIAALLQKGWATRVQMALVATDSVPEPDLAVVRGARRDYLASRPTGADTALVVEVAESSLAIDRQKARIYAAAGVPTYWIVNGNGRCIEIHIHPTTDMSGESSYTIHEVLSGPQTFPLIVDGILIGTVRCDQILLEP